MSPVLGQGNGGLTMRDVLFRGRRIDNGEWVCSGNILTFVDDHVKTVYIAGIREKCVCTHDEADNVTGIEGCVFYKVDPEAVGAWTAVSDI